MNTGASSDNLAQGQLYVIGGSNGHSDELSCGERYDPQADEWIQVPELRTNRCNAGQSLRHQGAIIKFANSFFRNEFIKWFLSNWLQARLLL